MLEIKGLLGLLGKPPILRRFMSTGKDHEFSAEGYQIGPLCILAIELGQQMTASLTASASLG